jgi:hypothetical protein
MLWTFVIPFKTGVTVFDFRSVRMSVVILELINVIQMTLMILRDAITKTYLNS